LLQNPAANQIPTQTYVPVDNVSLNLPQNDTEWFDNIEDKYNINTDKK
ncbi:27136_t:CDS:2, partial [Racocetra persica]